MPKTPQEVQGLSTTYVMIPQECKDALSQRNQNTDIYIINATYQPNNDNGRSIERRNKNNIQPLLSSYNIITKP